MYSEYLDTLELTYLIDHHSNLLIYFVFHHYQFVL